MSTCPSCSAELQGKWKFCLQCGEPLTAEVPAAIRPSQPDVRPLNTLSVVAIALGVIGGPVAAIFGHVAMRQIRETGERGMVLARIATGLGYLWLAVWVAVISWLVVTGAI
jgi:hypothetical protein